MKKLNDKCLARPNESSVEGLEPLSQLNGSLYTGKPTLEIYIIYIYIVENSFHTSDSMT